MSLRWGARLFRDYGKETPEAAAALDSRSEEKKTIRTTRKSGSERKLARRERLKELQGCVEHIDPEGAREDVIRLLAQASSIDENYN